MNSFTVLWALRVKSNVLGFPATDPKCVLKETATPCRRGGGVKRVLAIEPFILGQEKKEHFHFAQGSVVKEKVCLF